jgi:threonine dehydrogenase-like Zn-dependent dehydrogenase
MTPVTRDQRMTVGAVLVEPGRLELLERPLPALGPTDVLVEVSECGVCASDVDVWLGRTDRVTPEALGHEPTGTVVHVGRDVARVAPGDRVACWVEGGGFSDAVVTDQIHCLRVGDATRHAVLAEPLACIVNAVELAAPRLADDIVVVGAGFMGNLLQLVLRLRGPRSITVADLRQDALDRAARLGATHTVNTGREDLGERVGAITEGRGADIAFEVTGVNAALESAARATRMSGKIGIVGYHQGGTRQIELGRWNWMAYEIVNAHFRERQTILDGMRTGLRLLEAGLVSGADLISHVFPLDRIGEAFELAAAKPDGFAKAVIAAQPRR